MSGHENKSSAMEFSKLDQDYKTAENEDTEGLQKFVSAIKEEREKLAGTYVTMQEKTDDKMSRMSKELTEEHDAAKSTAERLLSKLIELELKGERRLAERRQRKLGDQGALGHSESQEIDQRDFLRDLDEGDGHYEDLQREMNHATSSGHGALHRFGGMIKKLREKLEPKYKSRQHTNSERVRGESSGLASQAVDKAKEAGGEVTDTVADAYESAKDTAQSWIGDGQQKLNETAKFAGDKFEQSKDVALDSVQDAKDKASYAAAAAGDKAHDMKEQGKEKLHEAEEGAASFAEAVKKTGHEAEEGAKSIASDAADQAQRKGQEMKNCAQGKIEKKQTEAMGTYEQASRDVKEGKQDVVSAGEDCVQQPGESEKTTEEAIDIGTELSKTREMVGETYELAKDYVADKVAHLPLIGSRFGHSAEDHNDEHIQYTKSNNVPYKTGGIVHRAQTMASDAYDGMCEMPATITNAVSSTPRKIKDTVVEKAHQVYDTVVSPVMDTLPTELPEKDVISEKAAQAKDLLVDTADSLTPNIVKSTAKKVVEAPRNFYEKLVEMEQYIQHTLMELVGMDTEDYQGKEKSEDIKDGAEKVGQKVSETASDIGDYLSEKLQQTGELSEDIKREVQARIVDAIQSGKETSETIRDKTSKLSESAKSVISDAIDLAQRKAHELKGQGQEAFDEGNDYVQEKASDLDEYLKDKQEQAGELTEDLKRDLQQKISEAMESGKETAETIKEKALILGEGAKSVVSDAIDQAQRKAKELKEGAEDKAEEGQDKAQETISDIGQYLEEKQEKSGEFAQDVKDNVQRWIADVIDSGKETAESIQDKCKSLGESARCIVADAIEQAQQNAKELKKDAEGKVEKGKDKVQEKAGQAKDKASQMKEGAKSMAYDVKDQAKRQTPEAKKAAQHLKGRTWDKTSMLEEKAKKTGNRIKEQSKQKASDAVEQAEEASADDKIHSSDKWTREAQTHVASKAVPRNQELGSFKVSPKKDVSSKDLHESALEEGHSDYEEHVSALERAKEKGKEQLREFLDVIKEELIVLQKKCHEIQERKIVYGCHKEPEASERCTKGIEELRKMQREAEEALNKVSKTKTH